jgi:hypothetical protein
MGEDTTRRLPDDAPRQILARFDSMDAWFDSLEMRMTALEDKVDRRLQETRPIWEQVLGGLTKVETRLGKVEDEVFWPGRDFRNWTRDMLKLQEKHEDLEERFEESKGERSK